MKQFFRLVAVSGLAACLLSAGGCKSSKEAGAPVVSERAKAHNEFFDAMQEKAFRYRTLTARLNMDLTVPGKELSSRVDLKMVKDSAFQLSVQPMLGIELFRIELSTDSVKVIDRLNKRYAIESYGELKGQVALVFNFYNLQALFTNHLFMPGEQEISSRQYNRFQLTQEKSHAKIRIEDAMKLCYTFMADGGEKLLSTHIADESERYALQWAYDDFRPTEEQLFPMAMSAQFLMDGVPEGGIRMRFSRIQPNVPVNMEFSIPAKYKQITFADMVKGLGGSDKKK
ncbi:MAG: DUF4292 domain-containing protein [Tannerellaceae bacterium]|jgi:hypothetical protein|nr:DUF4292 domain-containing protein [Tannerellaceae bacterium]